MSDVPIITNFKLRFKQNFLSKTYIFSWDNINPPSDSSVFYSIYLNNKLITTITNNFFSLNSGVGCEEKCVKIKTKFKNNTTQVSNYSMFSKELCFTSPPDRYCSLPANLWQSEKISDIEKRQYQQKLENLKIKKTSSKMRYAIAIKNKASASSFLPTGTLRSFYYKECE